VTTPTGEPADRRWPRSVYGEGTEPDPRFSPANERTFLAWIRTALGFVAAGVAVAELARIGSRLVGVEVRVAALVLAPHRFGQWRRRSVPVDRNERALRRGERLPSTFLLPVVTGVLVVVALIALLIVGLSR
jgi:putative membrane protein